MCPRKLPGASAINMYPFLHYRWRGNRQRLALDVFSPVSQPVLNLCARHVLLICACVCLRCWGMADYAGISCQWFSGPDIMEALSRLINQSLDQVRSHTHTHTHRIAAHIVLSVSSLHKDLVSAESVADITWVMFTPFFSIKVSFDKMSSGFRLHLLLPSSRPPITTQKGLVHPPPLLFLLQPTNQHRLHLLLGPSSLPASLPLPLHHA